MEIVLGIDNVIFIAILSRGAAGAARRGAPAGLGLALVLRIALLLALTWIMGLTAAAVHRLGQGISGRDLVLLGGGLFLIAKATHEIYESVEVAASEERGAAHRQARRFGGALVADPARSTSCSRSTR